MNTSILFCVGLLTFSVWPGHNRLEGKEWWAECEEHFSAVLKTRTGEGKPLFVPEANDAIHGGERNTMVVMFPESPLILVNQRADSKMVGAVMALLATFQDANTLPPEGTPQANQLIHGLIQFQSALVKSPSPKLVEYRNAAVHHWNEGGHEEPVGSVQQDGLTSTLLAALVSYAHKRPMWDQPDLVRVFHAYNVTREDWELIDQIFIESNEVFRAKGNSIHQIYRQWRDQMPGGKG